ncbi:WD40 repeat domain-containing protein [Streptomyces microflavus]|uniref:WD40 repeat domain-containing protein n=1 Tax=Streptomyces microflavus TaxID=1919 RepID=UPI0038041509
MHRRARRKAGASPDADGTWLTTASSGTVRVWDRATGTCTATLTGHTEPVNSVASSPDGAWFATDFQSRQPPGRSRLQRPPSRSNFGPASSPEGELYRDRTAIRVGKSQVSSFQLTIPTWGLRSVAALFQRGECACLPILPCAVALAGLHSHVAPSAFPTR